jgi:hypothetical protein
VFESEEDAGHFFEGAVRAVDVEPAAVRRESESSEPLMRPVRAGHTRDLIAGAASVVFGVLALSWPDVTVFVVAVLFGARGVVRSLATLLDRQGVLATGS